MGISSLLSTKDRNRLREITRRVHLRHYPKEMLTDYECDKLIDSFSEQVIEANLRAGLTVGMID
jgi:hypothetical protein